MHSSHCTSTSSSNSRTESHTSHFSTLGVLKMLGVSSAPTFSIASRRRRSTTSASLARYLFRTVGRTYPTTLSMFGSALNLCSMIGSLNPNTSSYDGHVVRRPVARSTKRFASRVAVPG